MAMTSSAWNRPTETERWRRARPAGGANLFGGERVIVLDDLNPVSIVATLDPTDGTTDDTSRPVVPPDWYAYTSHPSTIGGLTLRTSPASIPNGQRIDIEVVAAGPSFARSSTQVPGFVARLVPTAAEPLVIVIDQTGGTGSVERLAKGTVDTRITAYTGADGHQVWQVAAPGTPQQVWSLGLDLLIIANGSAVTAYDPATGRASWTTNGGSPGQSGPYKSAGIYHAFPTEDPLIGLIIAERPYAD